MTTARDYIEKLVGDYDAADGIIAWLKDGPESVRLELAGMLNPWRPIETAPKADGDDEAWLLGCDEDGNCAVIQWNGDCWVDNYGGTINPTYFQFLPAPP